MPSIIPQLLATDSSHRRAKSLPSESRCSVTSRQAGGTARRRDGPRRRQPRSTGMGPASASPGAQGWAPPAPAQESRDGPRRCRPRSPQLGQARPALCVGPVPAQAPAFTNLQDNPPLPRHLHPLPQPFPWGCFSGSEQPLGNAIANHADIHTGRPSSIASPLSCRGACNTWRVGGRTVLGPWLRWCLPTGWRLPGSPAWLWTPEYRILEYRIHDFNNEWQLSTNLSLLIFLCGRFFD